MTLSLQQGFDLTYDTNKDITVTLNKISDTLKTTLKNGTKMETEIKLQNVTAVSTLLYGSETWLLNQRDYSPLTDA
jgi:hypothetical protein